MADSPYERSIQGDQVQNGTFVDPSLPMQWFDRVPINAQCSNEVVARLDFASLPILAEFSARKGLREGSSNPQSAVVVVQLEIARVIAAVRALDLSLDMYTHFGNHNRIDPRDGTHLSIPPGGLVKVCTLFQDLDGW